MALLRKCLHSKCLLNEEKLHGWCQATLRLSIIGNETVRTCALAIFEITGSSTKQNTKKQNRETSTQLSYSISTQNDIAFLPKNARLANTMRQSSHANNRKRTLIITLNTVKTFGTKYLVAEYEHRNSPALMLRPRHSQSKQHI